jgi:hypothetical protein
LITVIERRSKHGSYRFRKGIYSNTRLDNAA